VMRLFNTASGKRYRCRSCSSQRSNRSARAVRDESGSIIIVMLVAVVAAILTLVVFSNVSNQTSATSFDVAHTGSLEAAQAGIDVMLGHIRGATDNTGNGTTSSGSGIPSELPCGTLAGTVDPSGVASYSATVSYYNSSPTCASSSWLSTNQVTCTTGSGLATIPSYALITSTGSQGTGNTASSRTVQSTYVFDTSDANIPGGLIHVYDDDSSGWSDLCWDAGSSPAVGTLVTLQPCVSDSAEQMFAYQTDLSLAVVETDNSSTPLCVTAPEPSSTGTNSLGVDGTGAIIWAELEECTDLNSATISPDQQWSFNDIASFEGADSNGDKNLDDWCFVLVNPTNDTPQGDYSGGQLAEEQSACDDSNDTGTYNTEDSWNPAASVGAGMAGASTDQLVNFKEFGRCLDDTNQSPSSTWMIDWQCKQSPNPANITWNQLWQYSNDELITVYPSTPATDYCLTSPGVTSTSTQTNPVPAYVDLTVCSTSDQNQDWTVNGNTNNPNSSYTVVDYAGYCLNIGEPGTTSGSLAAWSAIIVSTCDGSLGEKWNAPANLISSAVENTYEH
jgi:Tfp pilus assembly protein PilX